MNPGTPEKHVLLIEDDEVFSSVLGRALERRGYRVSAINTHAEALAAVRRLLPGFVVLDLNLAGENGMQLIAPIRQSLPDCRIVVLTGYASIATAVKAIKLGAAEYLAKPVEASAVVRALEDIAADGPDEDDAPDVPLSVDQVEWEHIQRVLNTHEGNITATARALNMHRRTLQRKLAKHAPRRRVIENT
jgi:two-component system response regulator RegA